jgi:hypothetical protein
VRDADHGYRGVSSHDEEFCGHSTHYITPILPPPFLRLWQDGPGTLGFFRLQFRLQREDV